MRPTGAQRNPDDEAPGQSLEPTPDVAGLSGVMDSLCWAAMGSSKFCVDDRSVFHCLMFASGVTEDPNAQQLEAGPAIHRALDRLQPVDLALDLPTAPRLAQGGAHRILVAADPGGER